MQHHRLVSVLNLLLYPLLGKRRLSKCYATFGGISFTFSFFPFCDDLMKLKSCYFLVWDIAFYGQASYALGLALHSNVLFQSIKLLPCKRSQRGYITKRLWQRNQRKSRYSTVCKFLFRHCDGHREGHTLFDSWQSPLVAIMNQNASHEILNVPQYTQCLQCHSHHLEIIALSQ